MREVDVVVVGAGLAGLAAARQLKAAGRSIAVVEARERVGGRTLNQELAAGGVVEVGGQWVGPTQTAVLALARELGVDTFPTHVTGKNIIGYRGRLHRYRGSIPLVASPGLAEGYVALKRLERMARSVAPRAPWEAHRAKQWDEQTLQTWTTRSVRSTTGRNFVTAICESVWACQPADVSLLHVLAYIASAGGIDALIDTAGGAQERRIVGGSQRLALTMAAELAADELMLNEQVHRIERDGSTVAIWTEREQYRARRVVVAVSPSLAGRIDYRPALPAARDALTQRMPNGSVIKCMAVYPDPFWRADGLSGQAVLVDGPVKIVFDNSPSGGDSGVLVAFLEGDAARTAPLTDPDNRRRMILDVLERLFGPAAQQPIEFIEKDWTSEQFTRGCYGAVLPPNTWTSFGHALREPVGGIHWASAETAEVWMGYMDGAIRAGRQAAGEVDAALS